MKRRIVASQIAVEWNDKPKLVVLMNDMPEWVREPFDEWLRDIENEENAITEEAWSLKNDKIIDAEANLDSDNTDYKWADNERHYDKDWNLIEVDYE